MTPGARAQAVVEESPWTPYTRMEATHHHYGRKCGCMSSRTDWEPCRGQARYVSTLGHCAVVRCEDCYKQAIRQEGEAS